MQDFPSLEELVLSETGIDDLGLQNLRKVKKLTILDVSYTGRACFEQEIKPTRLWALASLQNCCALPRQTWTAAFASKGQLQIPTLLQKS